MRERKRKLTGRRLTTHAQCWHVTMTS